MTLPPHVRKLADRAAAGHGVEVLELNLRRQGRSQVLSVVLDSDDRVDADVVEQVTKELSRALDEEDPLPGRYTPGPQRTIQREASGGQPRAQLRGVVATADDQSV